MTWWVREVRARRRSRAAIQIVRAVCQKAMMRKAEESSSSTQLEPSRPKRLTAPETISTKTGARASRKVPRLKV
ncbi:hypothetical protein [Streptomyces erythrochromogenes]|uniref:hypothetical protein n=1 Tax=Streptomyces erythrochromogenes TaxID=285574 RepID=UPI00224EBC4A|nr:hypothetical protein [Streptomyces erythrochromogenes]MCX5583994.1 hypothetical protein [Streptomyces erythrochromogenes]